MKKWYRLTALVLAFAIVLSTVSGALAQVEVNYGDYQSWVEDTKAANGLAGVISIDEGGEVLVEPSTFTGETNAGPQYTSETTHNLGSYTADSAPTVDVALEQYGKVTLAAPAAGQWQAYLAAADLWVDIAGETGSTFALTFAKVQSLFMANGHAQLRCKMGDAVTETVNVGISYSLTALPASTQQEPAVLMMAKSSGNDGIALAADEPELADYSIVINYVFENDAVVADPYTATLAAGSNFSATVKHPVIMGYLPYVGNETETSTEINLNITNIQADVTYTVTYKPTNVDYTVIHYWQNLDNDNYTEHERETLQGLTKTTVPEVANKYAGFYALLYEKPEIAADGSTVVEVYYDRYYYLMNFELSGGYGVEPIYARYGAPVGTIKTPTRAGYTFNGWSPAVPDTVPVDGGTYTAQWTMDKTAKVTVVFWGENADDEEYSYLSTTEMELESGTQYIYGGATLMCTQEAHKHVDTCLQCTENEHTHSAACYTLICTVVHEHSKDCYKNVGSAVDDPDGNEPSSPKEGEVYVYERIGTDRKYIYIDGQWYSYSGSTSEGDVEPTTCTPHVHTDYTGSCYQLNCTIKEHSHSDNCYKCGITAHRHNADCFSNDPAYPVESERYLWTFAGSDVVTVAPDGSTVVNVYFDRTTFTLNFKNGNTTVKSIIDKWGADIHNEFPIKNSSGETMLWNVPDNCVNFEEGTYLASINRMPPENINFTLYAEVNAATIYYCIETLPGETYTHTNTYNGVTKYFKLYKTVKYTKNGYLTYAEEFHDILGFKQWDSDPEFSSFDKNGKTNYINDNNYLYYTRNAYDIVYYNPTDLLKTNDNVPYEMPLTTYYWEPTSAQAPAQYEPGSVTFDGWYLNPECTGEEFDFKKQTMPAGPNNTNGEVALSLYAKWVPITHTVEFYLDLDALNEKTKIGDSHPDLTVAHGSKVEEIPAKPTNGSYKFVGWFYMDNGEEKAFDFANMPINRDMKVYGKWSSDVLKNYFVYFKIQGTDTQIADPITGSALAGETKTFDAKGDTDLYADYQEGYFPLVQSHSMKIDIENDANNIYTFEYVKKDAVPYTVYYVAETLKDGGTSLGTIERDGKTYYIIADTYTNSDNRKAVVTEKFKTVSGYMPDAYQKRLVVDGTENAVNEIIFYYSVDTTHAYYKITHYTQNTDGKTWTEYASSQAVGVIGETYTANPLTIDGFTYDSTVPETVVSGELTANGLELKLYYVRNSYPYQVRYLEYGTGTQLHDPKPGTGKYGQVISESAIEIAGYSPVDPTSQTLTIKIEKSQTEATLNIITFYYTENDVTINYVVVGPDGCGTVTPESETVKVLTGTAQGSVAAANETYRFVGWYTDKDCKNSVTAADGTLSENGTKFVPEKESDGLYAAATFYAKFELDVADLTIKKQMSADSAVEQSNPDFTFKVTINNADANKTYAVKVYNAGTNEEVTAKSIAAFKSGGNILFNKNEYAVVEGVTINDTYTIEEIDLPTGYRVVSGEVKTATPMVAGAEAIIINKYTTGSLTIEKTVVGTHAPKDGNGAYSDEFTFTIDLTNAPAGTYGELEFTDKPDAENVVTADTKLKHGESITISNIPVGATYSVTETENTAYVTEKTCDSGQISTTVSTAKFTNTYREGWLTIKKTGMTSGENAIFNVKLGSNVVRQVVVPNGQIVKLLLPAGNGYAVEEVDSWTGRYESTIAESDFDGVIEHGKTDSVTYNNVSKNNKWLTDESIKSNEFKPEGGDQ